MSVPTAVITPSTAAADVVPRADYDALKKEFDALKTKHATVQHQLAVTLDRLTQTEQTNTKIQFGKLK
jgi:hypothetical protein